MNDLLSIGPLLLVAGGGLGMMLADAFVTTKAELALVTAVILFGAAAMSLGLWFSGAAAPSPEWVRPYLATDQLAHFLDLVICGGGGAVALLAGGYLREHAIERGEFYVVRLCSALGAMALSRAVDLLTLFIGLETMSLGIYGLVAYRRHSPRAAEGALKYFLLGSFASAILLFGSALLYGATGQTNLVRIGSAIPALVSEGTQGEGTLLLLAVFLMIVGLAFKVSAVPFHAWTPDAYEGAATPATSFMAVVVKAAVFGVMLRLFFMSLSDGAVANEDSGWPPAIAALSAFTMIFGNLAAIVQKSVKRMLAYSAIAHAGYLLLGVVAAWKTGGAGIGSVLYYLAAYASSTVLAFGALILAGSRGKEAVTYEDLAGLGRRHPLLGLAFSVGVLSLMGFPPLVGFFGKYYIILSAVNAGGGLVWLAVIAVLTSAIGAYYYLRVTVFLFMKKPEENAPVAVPMRSGYVVAALVLASYVVVRLGVAPDAYLRLVGATRGDAPDPWIFVIDGALAILAATIAAALSSREQPEGEAHVERPEPAHSS